MWWMEVERTGGSVRGRPGTAALWAPHTLMSLFCNHSNSDNVMIETVGVVVKGVSGHMTSRTHTQTHRHTHTHTRHTVLWGQWNEEIQEKVEQ